MPDSTSADTNWGSFGDRRIDPASRVAVVTSVAESEGRVRLRRTEAVLRHAEVLWISNKTAIAGSIVAFHDPEMVDETLVPCFMLPSLPQQSTDFIELAGMMDPRQPFFGVYLPSDKRNAETASTLANLAHYYASEIHKLRPTGPICVGGWSAGPTVALVVAERLRELGHPVPLLVVIDGAPPAVDSGHRSRFEKLSLAYYRLTNAMAALARLGYDLSGLVWSRSPQHASFRGAVKTTWRNSPFRPIWQRASGPIARKVAALLPGERLAQGHAADAASDTSALPQEHRDLITALFDAIHAYQPAANYADEVVVFESTAEPARSSGNVAKRWVRIATNVTVVPVKGSHVSILAEPDGRPLANYLGQKLRDVSARQHENV
jgi:thioesterase domain-containing protein